MAWICDLSDADRLMEQAPFGIICLNATAKALEELRYDLIGEITVLWYSNSFQIYSSVPRLLPGLQGFQVCCRVRDGSEGLRLFWIVEFGRISRGASVCVGLGCHRCEMYELRSCR
jgi:hypothetical protein